MLKPKYPPNYSYTPPAVAPAHLPEPTAAEVQPTLPAPLPVQQNGRPVVQLTPGSVATLVIGGTAVVVVVGVVLVSMLLAVAVTAASVAVVAVVARAILNDSRKGR
ncbi:hypothetical protein GA0115240_176822 [Streptomyces sp. DvalAA-14]|uniref:SpdD protein n=1 Tax=unclassified Streptomyces TaxID=2593676 RepID=UPI00081BB58D|nr:MULTISPECIES: SpdD protein [unclassified Streptomyces]MYS25281.1 SpdD protein [Streptomyces sp. SID4948]SCE53446.1 hypothetical protein GA0115240_176822 [Streptomyces sp. DvalAA-14]